MENKINIAELLKDCPKGMELDCTMFENTFLERVEKNIEYPIVIRIGKTDIIRLTKDGCWNKYSNAKCVIFPKGKTTWEGFHRPFKDGDIVTWKDRGSLVAFIYKERKDVAVVKYHFALYTGSLGIFKDGEIALVESELVFATEEEKAKLFDAIKTNGYRWNEENRDWSKFQIPFKDGDILIRGLADCRYNPFIFKQTNGLGNAQCYCAINVFGELVLNSDNWTPIKGCRLATEGEKQKLFQVIKDNGYKWNAETKTLSKLVQHNFKAGDKIEKCGYRFTIAEVKDDYYLTKCGNKIPIDNQDDFSLVPNKFDVTTLKPFDNKVLVRDKNTEEWRGHFFSHYDSNSDKPYVCIGVEGLNEYKQCIPYEGNEHLLGTTNDCDDYYKTW